VAALADEYAVADATAVARAARNGDAEADGYVDAAQADGHADQSHIAIADADESGVAAGGARAMNYFTNSTLDVSPGGTTDTYPADLKMPLMFTGRDEELTLEQRIEQLEDALLSVVRRLAMLEWQMEAIDGESGTSEM
jgi:hypothetical protein